MPTTATLKFAVELTQQPSAALIAAVAAVLPPYALLTQLGVFVLTDSTAAVAPVPPQVRTRITRTMVLTLQTVSPAALGVVTDAQNRILSVPVSGEGVYGGQPLVFQTNFVPVSVPRAPPGQVIGPAQAPLLRANMAVVATVVPQTGSGYTFPTIIALGGMMAGGTPPVFAPVIGGGGALIAINVFGPNGPYCQAPILQISDPTGSGAQAMATLGIGSVSVLSPGPGSPVAPVLGTTQTFALQAPTNPAAAMVFGNLMGQQIGNAVGFPVIVTPPVIA
jgi:hypothetical protein